MTYAGTVEGCTIFGIDYDCPADTDINLQPSGTKIEKIPTSGEPITKKMKQIKAITGLKIVGGLRQYAQLAAIQEAGQDGAIEIRYPGGDSVRITGQIDITGSSSQNGTIDVDIHPNVAIAFQYS